MNDSATEKSNPFLRTSSSKACNFLSMKSKILKNCLKEMKKKIIFR